MKPVRDMTGAQVPVWLLKATRSFLRSFQWARDAADRLVLPDPWMLFLRAVSCRRLDPCEHGFSNTKS